VDSPGGFPGRWRLALAVVAVGAMWQSAGLRAQLAAQANRINELTVSAAAGAFRD
jgi:hypothetical protein